MKVDPFEDLVFLIACGGMTEREYKNRISIIKKLYKMSFTKIKRILDNKIDSSCWNHDCVDNHGLYSLPFEKMAGCKYWQLYQYIDDTDAQPAWIQRDLIWAKLNLN